MAFFSGIHEHTIDSKNRLSIPAEFRAAMSTKLDGRCFYVVPGTTPHSLRLFTEKQFEGLAARLGSHLIESAEVRAFKRKLFSFSAKLEPDPQGRVLIPEFMLRMAGLSRDVVIRGIQDHLEIHSREEWERHAADEWKSFSESEHAAYEVLERERRQSGGRPPE